MEQNQKHSLKHFISQIYYFQITRNLFTCARLYLHNSATDRIGGERLCFWAGGRRLGRPRRFAAARRGRPRRARYQGSRQYQEFSKHVRRDALRMPGRRRGKLEESYKSERDGTYSKNRGWSETVIWLIWTAPSSLLSWKWCVFIYPHLCNNFQVKVTRWSGS